MWDEVETDNPYSETWGRKEQEKYSLQTQTVSIGVI